MKIFILSTIIIIAISFIVRKFFYVAKRNLFKDQAAWSGKDINIKYSNSKVIQSNDENDNYLQMVADQSKIYLNDQSKEGD